MRAFHRVSGRVRLDFTHASDVGYESNAGRLSIVIDGDEFEELAQQIRDGDPDVAELRRERDTWKRAAHSHAADLAKNVDDMADVIELRAVIVSQAREITRLKGEDA